MWWLPFLYSDRQGSLTMSQPLGCSVKMETMKKNRKTKVPLSNSCVGCSSEIAQLPQLFQKPTFCLTQYKEITYLPIKSVACWP